MCQDIIKAKIADAFAHEERTGECAELIRNRLSGAGMEPHPKKVEGLVRFVREYIELVPFYIEQARVAAAETGLGKEMESLLSRVESYWYAEDDVIPEYLGLIGVVDDAYYSLMVLQSVSDYLARSVGEPLLAHDLTHRNKLIRRFMGEPYSSNLDRIIGDSLGEVLVERLIADLQPMLVRKIKLGGAVDDYWGEVSIEEEINERLGWLRVS